MAYATDERSLSSTVTVTGTGFRPDVLVDVHQCEPAPGDPSACNRPVTSLTTDGSGGFVTEVAVTQLVQSGRLSLDGLITHSQTPDHAAQAYETAFADSDCLTMVLDWRH